MVKEIGVHYRLVSPSENFWSDSWKDPWTVTPVSVVGNSTSEGSGGNGPIEKGGCLRKGAMIGIAVGAFILGVICLALGLMFWRRSRVRKEARWMGKEVELPMESLPAELYSSLRPWALGRGGAEDGIEY